MKQAHNCSVEKFLKSFCAFALYIIYLHLVPILIQPVRREDNEKSRNGRGKGRSENSRKDTEQFEICR